MLKVKVKERVAMDRTHQGLYTWYTCEVWKSCHNWTKCKFAFDLETGYVKGQGQRQALQ